MHQFVEDDGHGGNLLILVEDRLAHVVLCHEDASTVIDTLRPLAQLVLFSVRDVRVGQKVGQSVDADDVADTREQASQLGQASIHGLHGDVTDHAVRRLGGRRRLGAGFQLGGFHNLLSRAVGRHR